jgi:hypothetical protein
MLDDDRKPTPTAFIAIGVCFLGAGVALTTALSSRGASGAGIGLIGIGVVFLIVGAVRRRRAP